MQPTTIMFLRILFILLWHCSAFSDAKQKIEKIQHQKPKILSIEANCTRDVMHVRVNMGGSQPFKGAIYAKGFSEECSSSAGEKLQSCSWNISIKLYHLSCQLPGSSSVILPLSACGIRSRFTDQNTMQYGVRIVVQMDAKLQQKSDDEAVAKCSVPSEMMDVNVQDVEPTTKQQQQQQMTAQRTGRMRHYMKPSSKVRAWLEVGSREGQDFSLVGENSTLKIRSFIKRSIGMRIVDCVAFDGVGESSQRLFDEFGCPIDAQLMDDFSEEIVNIEDGWSKLNDDDVVQKIHTTKFQAFKFPDRDIIHFNCGIMLCKGECPRDVCVSSDDDDDESKHRKKHKPLGRIEVFNSLKVLAPEIEIDRLGDKNFTNGEFFHHTKLWLLVVA